MSDVIKTQCCIAGCGPAGAMLGLLLARQGVDVVVLEKHTDFLRDFRGDDIAAATMEVLDEIGLAERFLSLSPRRVRRVNATTPAGTMVLADLGLVRTKFPFVAVVPQCDFLAMLTAEAARFPGFRLMMGAEATGVVLEGGVVRGVRYFDEDGFAEIRADLTVAADGRTSTLRQTARMAVIETSAPIDMMVFRLPRLDTDADNSDMNIHLGSGWAMARLNRGDYWLASCVIPKDAADAIRAAGLGNLRDVVSRVMPALAEHVGSLESWDQIHLLRVRTDRLSRWHRPGLLCIGDAAHAMSPIGGTGVNFAVHDAVVAANLLAGPLARGEGITSRQLAAVQRRRMWQVRVMQILQGRLTKGYLVAADAEPTGPRAAGRRLGPKMLNLPGFCAARSRVTALGLRRTHVRRSAAWLD
jgi:2-polyprenyl-6-methoxyphenol hydroxylase-like FAD-dependent oxidoreductase